jgi:hypothetical protein
MKCICPECGFYSEANPDTECPICHAAAVIALLNEQEIALAEAGYFLRDDTEMRKEWNDPKYPPEAYSFCKRQDDNYPFQRVHVFAGPKEWAIAEAYKMFQQGITGLTTWEEVRSPKPVQIDKFL